MGSPGMMGWSLLPSNLVSLSGAFRYSLLRVGKEMIPVYKSAPVLYAVLAGILLVVGKMNYRRRIGG